MNIITHVGLFLQAHALDPCALQGMDTYAFLMSQDGHSNNEGLEK